MNRNKLSGENRKESTRETVIAWLSLWYEDLSHSWGARYDDLVLFFRSNTMATMAAIGALAIIVAGAVLLAYPGLRGSQTAPSPAVEQPVAAIQRVKGETAPVKVEAQRWGSSVVFAIEGKDKAGKRAAFDVAILPKDLAWARKSATTLVQGADVIPDAAIGAKVFTRELREGLSQSSEVIAVGLASHEGQPGEETERAKNRARSAAGWLANALTPKTPIWLLNLGQFKARCKAQAEANADTSWQRPIIMVGVRSQQKGVRLKEAFADAISGKSNLPSRDCYSSFELTRFR